MQHHARTWSVTVILCGLVACSPEPKKAAPDKVVTAAIAAVDRCMRTFQSKRAAYIKRYAQEPTVYYPPRSPDETACPEISDQPPFSFNDMIKNMPVKPGGATGSGYDAGEAWAQDNYITDASECANSSRSFEQGCEDAVEESAASQSDQDTP